MTNTNSKWVRTSLEIGVLEFRRSVRALRQAPLRIAMIGFGATIPSLLCTLLVVVFADHLAELEALPSPAHIRGTVSLFWLFGIFLVGQRVVTMRRRIDAEPFVLTSVSARTAAGGLVIAETLRILAYLIPPGLLLTGVCVVLFGSPAGLVLVPVATVFFASTVVVAGSACGYAVALLVATSPFVVRHKTVLGTIASLLGMGGYFLFLFPEFGPFDQSSFAWLPIGWVVDLALAGTGLTTVPIRWLGAIVGSAVVLFVGGVTIERLTTMLWFIEPISVGSDETVTGTGTDTDRAADDASAVGTAPFPRDALATAVAPLFVPRMLSTPTRRVAEWVILRTRRDPNRLTFLMIPLFAIGSAVVNIAMQSDSIDTMAAPLCAVALPWTVGSLFAMNPFGDEGRVLPVTLTAIPGQQYVRGLVLPGLLIGLPVVTIATGLATLFSPYTGAERVGLIALGVFLSCIAVTIAPAVGMSFPRFSAISVGQSRDVIPPRMSAVAVHAVLIVLPGAVLAGLLIVPKLTRAVLGSVFGTLPAFLLELLASRTSNALSVPAGWFTALGDGIQELDPTLLQTGGGSVLLIGGVLVAIISYRYAVTQFEQFTTA
ncbi:hypothetical protein [Natrialba taiwanensis]|uniref:ABC-2 type transport system permease protein n=1 Tax=Natrialba taiwanensis DSM 12281 TaxID=1230458 RepID=M0A881_9EURY|nr:hypothetical protein [Natrialba taiwanensis]ELY94092.1 hypothetical protein C484_06699 [Natrialba taiwanensis DSM 12281]